MDSEEAVCYAELRKKQRRRQEVLRREPLGREVLLATRAIEDATRTNLILQAACDAALDL